MTTREYDKLACEHANAAASLLRDVDSRTNEGPMYGAVKAESANAHATLALFYQRKSELS